MTQVIHNTLINFSTEITTYWVIGIAAVVAYYFEEVRPLKGGSEE